VVAARSWRSGEGSLAGRPRVGRRAAEQPLQVSDRDIQLPGRSASPVAQLLNVSAGDDTKAAVTALTSVLEITPLLDQLAQLVPYAAVVPPQDNLHVGGQRHPLLSNGLADHLTPELSEQLAAGLGTRIAPRLSIRSVGGAVNDLPADATGYAHRHQNFSITSVGLGASATLRAVTGLGSRLTAAPGRRSGDVDEGPLLGIGFRLSEDLAGDRCDLAAAEDQEAHQVCHRVAAARSGTG
jgi:hypothetical protein